MKEWIGASLIMTLSLVIMMCSIAVLMRETHLMQKGIERYVLNK